MRTDPQALVALLAGVRLAGVERVMEDRTPGRVLEPLKHSCVVHIVAQTLGFERTVSTAGSE